MKAIFVLLFLIFYSDASLAKEPKPSSFVLYYQPLHEFDSKKTFSYLNHLKILLNAPEAGTLKAELFDWEKKTKCQNFCSDNFKDPIFNRIKWNRLSLRLNKFCNFKTHKYCEKLANLHDIYMTDYKKLIRARKQARKQMLKDNY